MYSKQTVYDAHLNSKKHIKAAQKQATADAPPANPNGPPAAGSSHPNGESSHVHPSGKDKHRTAAFYTHLCTQLLRGLLPALNDTKSNVERRFSLTAREREQELLDLEIAKKLDLELNLSEPSVEDMPPDYEAVAGERTPSNGAAMPGAWYRQHVDG